MSKTAAYEVDTIDADELTRFFKTYSKAYLYIEQALLMLELDATDQHQFVSLHSAINSIEQAIQDIGFNELICLTSTLNKMVDSISSGDIRYQTAISDILLLAVDDIKAILEKIIEGDQRCVLLDRMPRVCTTIDNIGQTDEYYRDSVIRDALLLLDPSTEILEPHISATASLQNLFDDSAPDEEELAAYGVEENEDFVFFRALSEPLETRAHYWRGRSQRMLRLALKMNDYAGRPVDPNQLAAAVYMHDAGMALLPLDVINHQGELSAEHVALVKDHPTVGYELLRYMKQWREAANIVLQHHERVDGKGYPFGLTEDEICDGAKIIAIVDAIDARTHERVFMTTQARPLLRAAMEIGKHVDTQFSEKWVDVFKAVFQQMRKQQENGESEAT